MPKNTVTTTATSVVNPTCRVPPMATSLAMRLSRSSENSRPMVNSNKMTPISAIDSTACMSPTRARPDGPMTAPASMKPATAGRRRKPTSSAATTATPRIKTKSGRASMGFTVRILHCHTRPVSLSTPGPLWSRCPPDPATG